MAILAIRTIARHARSAAKGSGGQGAAGQGAGGKGFVGGKASAGSKTSEQPRTVSAPPPGPEEQLVAKLRRIEALHARPGSEGERVAAERARQRILERLQQLEASEPPVEFRFSLADQWSRHLFVALLRRYGISPYRYRGQRRTTVMARLSRAFVNETLWPEFLELQQTLSTYFDAVTDRVIEQALEVKASEAEERPDTARLEPVEHQGTLMN